MKNLFILFCISTFIGCQSTTRRIDSNYEYDVEILYNYQGERRIVEDKYRFKYSNDSIYLILESFFVSDKVYIKRNDKLCFSKTVTTEESSGLVNSSIVLPNQSTRSLGIKINNGPYIYLDLKSEEHNFIGVRKDKKKIQVVFYKKIPIFE